ncbi:MAG UNVERIFIED_CONTAM: sugar phosphate isomerase/epimerase [Planctomycetaceae bacterium]|jgi:hexulose-6-phosphate isomerase
MNAGLISRRTLLQSSAVVASSGLLLPTQAVARGAVAQPEQTLKGRLLKTLKFGMVRVEGTLTEKFKAVKAAGFDGIEMDAPGMNVEETKKAIAESGLPVDGTVNSTHWQVRHTDPDPAVRERALQSLMSAIEGTHAVGDIPSCW